MLFEGGPSVSESSCLEHKYLLRTTSFHTEDNMSGHALAVNISCKINL